MDNHPLKHLLISGAVFGGINAVGCVISTLTKTQKILDLFGVSSFVASSAVCCIKVAGGLDGQLPTRVLILNLAVSMWGARLAHDLFKRIMRLGDDERLNIFFPKEGEGWFNVKRSFFPVKLLIMWSIQMLWGWVVSIPVTLATFSPLRVPLDLGASLALGGFLFGFVYEAVADRQKTKFKKDPANRGKFMTTGLWSLSRHPNYFGELVMWHSLLGMSLPLLKGSMQIGAAVASPVFLTILLVHGTGVRPLENLWNKKYGKLPAYKRYLKSTPMLIPNLF
eukprot:230458_1